MQLQRPLLAPLGLRFAARLVDSTLIGVLSWILTALLWVRPPGFLTHGQLESMYRLLVFQFVWFGLMFVYDFLAIAAFQCTFGKRLAQIRVCERGSSRRPSAANALIRASILVSTCLVTHLVCWVATLGVVFFSPIGVLVAWLMSPLVFLRATWDKENQGLHDRLADTVVTVS